MPRAGLRRERGAHGSTAHGCRCDAGLPALLGNLRAALSSSGKEWAGVKCEIVVKTEPEDESYIGCPQGLGATVPSVPSYPSTGE